MESVNYSFKSKSLICSGESPEEGPEAAAQAAGAGGRVKHDKVPVPLFFLNMINENCETDSTLEKPKESETN